MALADSDRRLREELAQIAALLRHLALRVDAIIDRANLRAAPTAPRPWDNKPWRDATFSMRVHNAIANGITARKIQVETVGDLRRLSDVALLRLKNFGRCSLAMFHHELEDFERGEALKVSTPIVVLHDEADNGAR